MNVSEQALFATRMLSITFDIEGLNQELAELLVGRGGTPGESGDAPAEAAPLFEDFARDPDRFNLLQAEAAHPCNAPVDGHLRRAHGWPWGDAHAAAAGRCR